MRVISRLLTILASIGWLTACHIEQITNVGGIPSNIPDSTHVTPPPDTVVVVNVIVDSVVITRPIGVGCDTVFILTAHINPSNAPQQVRWRATNNGSISIDSTGRVRVRKTGTDTVFVTSTSNSTKTARIIITIVAGVCSSNGSISIVLIPASGSGLKGSTGQVTAKVTAPPGVDTSVIWYSHDPGIVSVAQKDGDAITYKGQVILSNVKGGTLWFAYPGTTQVCAQTVVDATVRVCGPWTTTGSASSYRMPVVTPVMGDSAFHPQFVLVTPPPKKF